ncbi:MAG: DedA family protein [Candidatus Daviesbacteria bacterium]|nr:DedA family protein [Candidatus Daviesbacteria bacterium]
MGRVKKVLEMFFSSVLVAPLILIAVYIGILFLIKGTALTPAQIISHFDSLYARYGYELIFLGAFLESLAVINFFVPGATIVVLGAVFARTGSVELTYAILVASLGSMVGFSIDYLLGTFGISEIINKLGYGSALNKAKNQINRSQVRTFALGFIHPDLGSFVSVAAGVLKISYKNFVVLAGLSTLTWTSLWGLLIFAFGKVFLVILTKYTSVLVILVLSIWLILTWYERRKD